MKKALYLLPFLVVLFALSVVAQRFVQDARSESSGTLVKFEGGIGVIPVASGVGQAPTAEVVNRNIVRGVQPPGPDLGDLRSHGGREGRRAYPRRRQRPPARRRQPHWLYRQLQRVRDADL